MGGRAAHGAYYNVDGALGKVLVSWHALRASPLRIV